MGAQLPANLGAAQAEERLVGVGAEFLPRQRWGVAVSPDGPALHHPLAGYQNRTPHTGRTADALQHRVPPLHGPLPPLDPSVGTCAGLLEQRPDPLADREAVPGAVGVLGRELAAG